VTEIIAASDQETAQGPLECFTGRATIRGQFAREQSSRVAGAIVSFEPGARTAWHSHPLGQTLIVLDGVGWTQTEDGPVESFSSGDILLCPADKRHWHGATPDGPMTHVAIQEALDGTNVTWIEHVTDDEYLAGTPQGDR
jgi:quercetin dioxygenase-like cupin family protein